MSTQELCPPVSARSSADLPFVSLTLAFAPRSSNSFTTAACPCHAALHRAFLTPASRTYSDISLLPGISSMTAPRSNRYETASVLPCRAAIGSAERVFNSAPSSKRAFKIGIEDEYAAHSIALDAPIEVFAFGSAPRNSKNWTISSSSAPTDRLVPRRVQLHSDS